MKSFRTRYKPVGWRGDSHRHYLAAKGIRTKTPISNRYFVRDELKGNRGFSNLHRAFAKGHSVSDLESDQGLRDAFNVDLQKINAFKKQSKKARLPEGLPGPSESDSEAFEQESFERLPEQELPVVEAPMQLEEPQKTTETTESPADTYDVPTVMTPGVPERSPLQFGTGTVVE